MSEVTYYVTLPFVFSDDGMAAGEAAEYHEFARVLIGVGSRRRSAS